MIGFLPRNVSARSLRTSGAMAFLIGKKLPWHHSDLGLVVIGRDVPLPVSLGRANHERLYRQYAACRLHKYVVAAGTFPLAKPLQGVTHVTHQRGSSPTHRMHYKGSLNKKCTSHATRVEGSGRACHVPRVLQTLPNLRSTRPCPGVYRSQLQTLERRGSQAVAQAGT